MSNHIDHNITPPKPQHCCGDMSFNHETGEMQGLPECGCAPSEIKPSKLDILIIQYEQLIQETTAYRDALIAAALGLNGIETESDAAVNRQIIIDTIAAAIPSVSSIQSGLAKTSELPVIPTDYAKDATVAKDNTVAKDATVAKEAAATANTNAILAAIASIVFDTTDLAKETSVSDGTDTTIGILKDIATDAEIYAMFPGAVDENGNISVAGDINEYGYLEADFSVNNEIITFI